MPTAADGEEVVNRAGGTLAVLLSLAVAGLDADVCRVLSYQRVVVVIHVKRWRWSGRHHRLKLEEVYMLDFSP